MNIAEKIRFIVVHCTAGFGDINSIIKFWREKLGWNGNGYSIIVDLFGVRWYITKDKSYSKDIKEADFDQITNGVLGWNDISKHLAYIGGVDPDDYSKAKDTRNHAQKIGIKNAIYDILAWLDANGKNIREDLAIVGHRDFSPDRDGSGVIEPWERIKECPSYPAINEHKHILNTEENEINGMLPNR